MKRTHNFKELTIWKKGMNIVEQTYQLTSKLPAEERFVLISQLNRCAISIPSNIAEGAGRSTEKDFINFLNIALSSSYELETQLILTNRLFDFDVEDNLNDLMELQKMIVGFKKSLLNT